MTGLMIFFLASSAFLFWVWVAGTAIAAVGSIFSDKIKLGMISGKLFSAFFLSLVGLAISAFIAKMGGA